jgi:hypothetical protein
MGSWGLPLPMLLVLRVLPVPLVLYVPLHVPLVLYVPNLSTWPPNPHHPQNRHSMAPPVPLVLKLVLHTQHPGVQTLAVEPQQQLQHPEEPEVEVEERMRRGG